jgi:hypothetical protein
MKINHLATLDLPTHPAYGLTAEAFGTPPSWTSVLPGVGFHLRSPNIKKSKILEHDTRVPFSMAFEPPTQI